LELYQTILQRFPDIYFIASGGVSAMEDVKALEQIGCSAAIVGKAIYEKRITLQQLADWKK
jgi:phosphoribosylformimino-5-aminoimidazole carboxamide ribotide isomerase